MNKPILHKHIIVRAECMKPPRECDKAVVWWEQLVNDIGMVKLDLPQNPICGYVDTPGNEGLTICGIIETSHIAMHVWDATEPALVQLDVYTCSTLNLQKVVDALQEFEPQKIEYKLFDREFAIEEKGSQTCTTVTRTDG